LDQRRVTAAPGALMLVPENTAHGFSNPGQTRSKLLIMFCPADSRDLYA
jgi:oxalate decarboxylase/phosphoglucose isomerase-like protein (cupin superfamily)